MNFPGRPGTALGTLGEPKNSLKIVFLLNNGVPNVLFRRFLCTKLASTIFARFFVDFSRKIDEKLMKKTMRFFRMFACFFQHGDPHETLYFIIRKLLFHVSRFFVFCKNIVEKRAPKSRPRFSLKNHPKVVPGDPFWDPKRSRINVGEVKKPKNVGNKSILDTVGF